MKAFLTMWNKPSVTIECKGLIVKDGAKIDVDGEETQMLIAIASDGIYHPVVDIEVL